MVGVCNWLETLFLDLAGDAVRKRIMHRVIRMELQCLCAIWLHVRMASFL